MPESDDRQIAMLRRNSFDAVADLYASARPGYPESLVSDLVELSRGADVRYVLEIGPGTGQLTVPLAGSGFSVLAVELGRHLAEVLERKLDGLPDATVVVSDFDEWTHAPASFDLVVAATAFHWLDRRTRTSRIAHLLRPGGALAIIETHWGAGARHDRFALESQSCYSLWDPGHDPAYRPPGPDDLPRRNDELEESDLFGSVVHKRYTIEREYSADGYCDLLRTFSNVRALAGRTRNGFLACIAELIRSRFEGSVARRDVCDLWFARTHQT